MRKIVSFSGGFDSTLALLYTLKTSDDMDEIICLSVYHKLTGIPKLDKERKARENIIEFLKNKYPNKILKTFELEVDVNWGSNDYGNNRGLCQPIFWICNIAPFVSDTDEVVLGYIKDDQASVLIDPIHRLWESAMIIQGNKSAKLSLPLILYSKSEVIVNLIKYDPELVDLCFSCESLGSHSFLCGECEPCNHLKSALISLICYEPKHIADKAREILKSKFKFEIEVKYDYKRMLKELSTSDGSENT